jgi:hypothetical protein
MWKGFEYHELCAINRRGTEGRKAATEEKNQMKWKMRKTL